MIEQPVAADCYERAGAMRLRVPPEVFTEALETSLARAFPDRPPSRAAVRAYLSGLHLADLALACACAAGVDEAWEQFVLAYRPVLYRAADALDPSGGARDLADALYAELFGLGRANEVRPSLFRYFHGRSSLATWLRSVLAQRHIDRLRERRRHDPLPDDEAPLALAAPAAPEPERARFVVLMLAALAVALARLTSEDRLRLACYYARRMTLAQVGRLVGEHEATVSRQLARARADIRRTIEFELQHTHHLDEASIGECLRSLATDSGPLDLAELLSGKKFGDDRSKDQEP